MANKKPVTIRGITYESRTQAAICLSMSRQGIQAAIKAERPDRAGLGQIGTSMKETIIRGAVYNTRQEAAESLGVQPSELSSFIKIAEMLQIDFS